MMNLAKHLNKLIKPDAIGIILTVFLLLMVINLVHYAKQKVDWHVDEIYSFTLSNIYQSGYLTGYPDFYDEWHDRDYIIDRITPNEHPFAYGSVYQNQANDVHPPLYYYIFHTINSLVPHTFSNWTGFIPNIIFFVLTVIILFFIAEKLFRNKWLSLLTVVIWGFSIGAINSVVFIRMYALLTLFIVLNVWLHFCLMDSKDRKLKWLIGIGLTTLMGFMTHYHYLIIAFFVSALFCIYKLIMRQWKDIIMYVLSIFFPLLLGYLYFPASLTHILHSNRGSEAIANFISRNDNDYLAKYFKIIDIELFGSYGHIFFMIVLLIMICVIAHVVIQTITDKSFEFPKKHFKGTAKENILWLGLVLVCVAFTLFIARTTPWIAERFLMGIFPLIILCVVYGLYLIYKMYFKSISLFMVIVPLLFAIMTGSSYGKNISLLHREHSRILDTVSEVDASHAVFIPDPRYGWRIHNVFLELGFLFDRIYITHDTEVSAELSSTLAELDSIVIYIYVTLEHNKIAQNYANAGKFQSGRILYQKGGFVAYYLSKSTG